MWLVTDNQNTYGDMLAILYNNTFFVRAGAGGNYQTAFEPGTGTPNTFYARVHEPTLLSTPVIADRNFYLFYPRLAGLASSGTAYLPYADDYRNPDPLTITTGSAWNDADELATADNFNEAEGTYVVQMNPLAGGLSVDLDGGTFVRRRPIFKIRQWRSLAPPQFVTVEGTNFFNGQGVTMAVKPVTRAYSCPTAACGTSTQRAEGGLTTDTDEFLADPTRNFTLDFSGTNHLYIGSDSKFRGLNVALNVLGTGTVDLQWQYWNTGSGWTNLEAVAGFTDQTQNFTRNGTVFWTADPGSWGRTNVVTGGIPLFYIRVFRASGGHTINPVEGLIKTDILLLQYCGDITTDFQTFSIALPVTTAVTLASFSAAGADGAVDLAWTTASELQNLGFHVHRAVAEAGPYERITATLVPGLGSSPTGASYGYRDVGLVNGQTYYYQLEDVETTGRTEKHGPVWRRRSKVEETAARRDRARVPATTGPGVRAGSPTAIRKARPSASWSEGRATSSSSC